MPGVKCLRIAHALRHHPYLVDSYLAHGSPVPPTFSWQWGRDFCGGEEAVMLSSIPKDLRVVEGIFSYK